MKPKDPEPLALTPDLPVLYQDVNKVWSDAIQRAHANGFLAGQIIVSTYGLKLRALEVFDNPLAVLFRHDFAKALFGEDVIRWPDDWTDFNDSAQGNLLTFRIRTSPAYIYHLQRMASENDPFTYLDLFLKQNPDKPQAQPV